MGSVSSSLCAPSLTLDLQSSSRDNGDVRRSRVVLLGTDVLSLSFGSCFTEINQNILHSKFIWHINVYYFKQVCSSIQCVLESTEKLDTKGMDTFICVRACACVCERRSQYICMKCEGYFFLDCQGYHI